MAARTRSSLPLLASSEWQIFYVLSKGGPMTVREIGGELVRLRPEFSAAYTTVLSYLHRLVAKGYVRQRRPAGPTQAHRFSARVSFDLALRRHVERFVSDFLFEDSASLRLAQQVLEEHLASPGAVEEPSTRP